MARKRIKVKLGKTQSKAGFIVGLLFVILGCVVVIPIFGPFGIVWTVVAGFIAFSHYKNGFTEEGMATHEIVIEDSEMLSSEPQEIDIEEKLLKLESLHNQGLISKEEYESKRKEILDNF